MSDIIIEGKNLSDINQSNFQTVGVRGSINFATNYVPNSAISVENNNFQYNTYDVHVARLGQNFEENLPGRVLLPKGLQFITLEPWQGRIHYDEDFVQSLLQSENPYEGLGMGFATQDLNYWQPNSSERGVISVPTDLDYASTSRLYFPYFYTSFMFDPHFSSDVVNTNYRINDFYKRIGNRLGYGAEEREPNVLITKDDRFPLGTYTEEDKQYWEIQTSDPVTRNSQMSSERMKVAQSTKDGVSKLIKSEEEQFSVDLFTFTEREGVTTPLFFYYDKNLHPIEYNKATTGKISFKIELRASGRNGSNELDLYQERKPIRPFLLGLEKDELRNGGTTVGNDPEELIGEGDVFGEGLYYGDQYLTLTAEPNEQSYLLGIYDIPDDNLVSSLSPYAFTMPFQDTQYLARFRPNPYIVFSQRFTDENGNSTIGGAESKGGLRAWLCEFYDDNEDSEWYVQPENNIGGYGAGEAPPFRLEGSRFFSRDFRPFDFGGGYLVIEQTELTENYKFKEFTFQSGSAGIEVPFPEENFLPSNVSSSNQILSYAGGAYDAPGNNINSIKIIKLVEDFRYPAGRLQIYANYGLIFHVIRNLNNEVDFENNFADALKYGPFKFVTSRKEFGDLEDFSFEDTKSFKTFENNEGPIRRLLIAAPGIGYANADYLPSGDNAHLTPIQETGYDFGNFVYHRLASPNSMTFPDDAIEEIIFKGPEEDEPITFDQMINFRFRLQEIYGNNTIAEDKIYPPTYDNNPASATYGVNLLVRGSSLFSDPTLYDGDNNPGIGGGAYDYGPGLIDQTTGGFFRVPLNPLVAYTQTAQDPDSDDVFYLVNWEVNPDLNQDIFDSLEETVEMFGGFDRNYYNLTSLETRAGYKGIQLKGYYIENNQGELVLDHQTHGDGQGKIMEIITSEITASISYQPLQRGVYVKAVDVGSIPTNIERVALNSMIPFRTIEESGAINAEMQGFGRSVVYSLSPQQESSPPQIQTYVAQENGDLTLSTDISPGLTNQALGIEWDPESWSPLGGGTIKYTAPDSRDATIGNENDVSKFWKYIEIRVATTETADGEQSENQAAADPDYFISLNVFPTPGAGGTIRLMDVNGPIITDVVPLYPIEGYDSFLDLTAEERTIELIAIPNGTPFESISEAGTWSFLPNPTQDANELGFISDRITFGNHIATITFAEPGPITIKYEWFGGPS